MRRHLTLGSRLAGLACVVLIATAAPASAAKSLSFSLQAVGQKSFFKYATGAGATVHGTVRVISTSQRPHPVLLRPADVSTGGTGGLAYGSARPRGVGTWLHLSRD